MNADLSSRVIFLYDADYSLQLAYNNYGLTLFRSAYLDILYLGGFLASSYFINKYFSPLRKGHYIMKKNLFTIAFLLPLFCVLVSFSASSVARPNFIIILTDDMVVDEFRFMPRTQEYFAINGVRFTNAFVSQAMCCPARTSILTGRYSVNSGVKSNKFPTGGWNVFLERGLESETMAAKLQAGGYSTAYFGKYMNEYGSSLLVPHNYIPVGWSHWYAFLGQPKYFNYTLNENGVVKSYGNTPAEYATDVLAKHAINHLNTALNGNSPFFMMISAYAPHSSTENEASLSVPVSAPRHKNLFNGIQAPRSASFNQANVSKKPFNVQSNPLLLPADIDWIDRSFRLRIQSLRSIDEMVGKLIDNLKTNPKADNTYIIFVSDNGFWFGDHRFKFGKGGLYDQSHRVPLAITGPSVIPGLVRDDLVINTDIFPTIMNMAGIKVAPKSYDGRSIRNLLESDKRQTTFNRGSFLLETSQEGRVGIRFNSYAYHETPQAVKVIKELYDTRVDPDQVYNIVDRLTGASAIAISDALDQLRSCSGNTCRQFENNFTDALVQFIN